MKIIFIFFLAISANLSSNLNTKDVCNNADLLKACKKELKPFSYSSMKVTPFHIEKDEFGMREVEVPLFSGEEYRFVFSLESMPQGSKVEVFDRNIDEKRRKTLFTSDDFGNNTKTFIFQPQSKRTLYVRFSTPVLSEETYGCGVMILGYQFKIE